MYIEYKKHTGNLSEEVSHRLTLFFGRSCLVCDYWEPSLNPVPLAPLRFSLSFLWLPWGRTHLICRNSSTVISRKSLAE